MQYFSDYVTARDERRKAERERQAAGMREWLAVATEESPIVAISDQRVAIVRDLRSYVADGRASRIGLACDNCGVELVNYGQSAPLTDPAVRLVGCINCGWTGTHRFGT